MFKPGDMVMVVRGPSCCGNTELVGRVGTVLESFPPVEGHCGHCGKPGSVASVDVQREYGIACWQSATLKLIPPFDEPESINTDEPLEVPA